MLWKMCLTVRTKVLSFVDESGPYLYNNHMNENKCVISNMSKDVPSESVWLHTTFSRWWQWQSLCITCISENTFHICGMKMIFFAAPVIPQGYLAQVVHGFVEELVVNDDPEYQWIDKIRTPRASNEARQTLFFKLSGEVQRKIGLKALDLGGNAVIG